MRAVEGSIILSCFLRFLCWKPGNCFKPGWIIFLSFVTLTCILRCYADRVSDTFQPGSDSLGSRLGNPDIIGTVTFWAGYWDETAGTIDWRRWVTWLNGYGVGKSLSITVCVQLNYVFSCAICIFIIVKPSLMRQHTVPSYHPYRARAKSAFNVWLFVGDSCQLN